MCCTARTAGIEDGARTNGDGLDNLPSASWDVNRGWMLAVNLASDLDAWVRLLALHDDEDLADAEPKTIRCAPMAGATTATRGAYRETQLCSVPGWIPRSSTIPGIGFPVSVMVCTAPSWKSAS